MCAFNIIIMCVSIVNHQCLLQWSNGTIPISLNWLCLCISEIRKWYVHGICGTCIRLALDKLFVTNSITSVAVVSEMSWDDSFYCLLFFFTHSPTVFTQLNDVNCTKFNKANEQTRIISIGHIRTIMKCSDARQVSLSLTLSSKYKKLIILK